MVQAPTKSEGSTAADLGLLPAPLRLKLPAGWEPTDQALIEISERNAAWRFELTAERELVIMSPEGLGSSIRGEEFSSQIWLWSSSGGGGRVFGPQMGVRLQDSSVQMPDVSWISEALWSNRDPDAEALLHDCPDLIVEIVSKSDSVDDQRSKMEQWIANGARLGWLIDPFRDLALIYRPGAEPEELARPDSLSGEAVCVGLEVSLERVWK